MAETVQQMLVMYGGSVVERADGRVFSRLPSLHARAVRGGRAWACRVHAAWPPS